MRLLHVLSQRPGRSGSGVFLGAMVAEAARRGYEQHVVVAGPPGTTAAELPPLRGEALSLIAFPSAEAPFPLPGNSDVMPYPSTVFSRMSELQIDQYLAASRRVMESARERFRPDLVHAHHLWLMTALAREVFDDVPVIATSHNAELRQAVKAPHLAARSMPGLQALDKVCVLTPQSAADTVDCFGVPRERIAITGAGFDDAVFRPAAAPPEAIRASLQFSLPEEPFVTWIGRLSTSKGIPFLVEAARRSRRRTVLIGATGTGEDGRRMEALVREAAPLVVHLGAQPQHAIARVLQLSAAFVLPSLFEGLPLTMLEALACGCPVIVSALPTIASWFDGEPALRPVLVPPLATTNADEPVAADVPRFIADLAAALADLPRPIEPMSDHTWSAVFTRYETIYEEAHRRRSPRL